MKQKHGWAAVAVLVITACSDPVAPDRDLPRDLTAPVQTDTLVYTVTREGDGQIVTIPFVYVNRTEAPVYVARCELDPPRYFLEKRLDKGWVTGYDPLCRDILYPPLEVPPGGAYTDTIRAWSSTRPNTRPVFETEIPGVYRAVLMVYRVWDPAEPELSGLLPEEQRVSNSFRLVVRP